MRGCWGALSVFSLIRYPSPQPDVSSSGPPRATHRMDGGRCRRWAAAGGGWGGKGFRALQGAVRIPLNHSTLRAAADRGFACLEAVLASRG